jgi:hypothetical protein
MLNGIQNFLQFINDNWTAIIVIASLIFALYQKIKGLFKKDKDVRFDVAKAQIKETMLKLITDAEMDYNEMAKAGSVKRSQVIRNIFEEYPILSKVTDQAAVVQFIDETINESLKTLRKIVAENKVEEPVAEAPAEIPAE